MEKITKFILPEVTEDLFKSEAKSSISLTKEVASKINELVDAYNELKTTRYDLLNEHTSTIRQGIMYMKDNLANTISELFTKMNNAGEIQSILDSIFTTTHIDSLNVLKEQSITVKNFGASGDGITDDTKAIQDTIDYATTHNRSVYLPSGTYLISSPIILKDVSLIGSLGTIIKCKTNDFTAIKQDVFGTRFDIRNITITDGYTGIELIRGKYSVFDRVNIENCSVAMNLVNSSDFKYNRFVNCLFNGHTYAVSLEATNNGDISVENTVFEQCNFVSESGRGIITKICRDTIFNNCIFNCGANALRSEMYSTFSLTNCTFKGYKKTNINSDTNIFYVISGMSLHIDGGVVYTTVEHDSIYFYGTDTDVTYGNVTISRPLTNFGVIETFKDFAKPVKRMQYVEE